jgi:DNA-binding CsgD family transcriptional regulator
VETTLIDLLGRPPGGVGDVDPVTRRLLDLYLGGLTLERAAAAASVEVEDASRRLRAEGVAAPSASLRPAGPPPELLAHLYVRDGLTTAAVGERLGLTPRQARYQLQRAGIRRPGPPARARTKKRLSPAELEDLYVARRLPIRAIAALVGLDQRDVWRQLTEAGIPRRRRGGAQVALGRETLEDLYVDQGLTLEATARRLGVGRGTVRRHLVAHGIPLQAMVRRPPTRRLLQRLYVAERLSPRQIAERLGLTHAQVRYDLVRLGIPRRPGGRPRQAAEAHPASSPPVDPRAGDRPGAAAWSAPGRAGWAQPWRVCPLRLAEDRERIEARGAQRLALRPRPPASDRNRPAPSRGKLRPESGLAILMPLGGSARGGQVEIVTSSLASTAVYDDAGPATDVAVHPTTDGGVRVMTVLDGPEPPRRFEFRVKAPDGATLRLADSGAIGVVDPSGTAIAVVEPASATDALDRPVPTHYEVEGMTITQIVDHGEDIAYPVVAYPRVSAGWFVYVRFNREEVKDFASRRDRRGGHAHGHGVPVDPGSLDRGRLRRRGGRQCGGHHEHLQQGRGREQVRRNQIRLGRQPRRLEAVHVRVNGGTPSRSDRLAKAAGAGGCFVVAVWATVRNPPEGAALFLLPVTVYWGELRAVISRTRKNRGWTIRPIRDPDDD